MKLLFQNVGLLYFIYDQLVAASDYQLKGSVNNLKKAEPKKKEKLSRDLHVQIPYNIQASDNLESDVYSITSENTLKVNGKEYNLNNLQKKKDLFSSNFIATLDGNEVTLPEEKTHWSDSDKIQDIHLFVSKDEHGNIEYLNIVEGHVSSSFVPVNKDANPGLLKKVTYNETKPKNIFSNNLTPDYIVTEYSDMSYMNQSSIFQNNYGMDPIFSNETMSDALNDTNFFQYNGCYHWKEIEVAIAYDHTFCNWAGGSNAAFHKVNQIVSLASARFQQAGLCITLKIPAVEGHCNYWTDPYNDQNMRSYYSGCAIDGLLQDFTKLWHYQRQNIKRDAAHLFVGRPYFDDNGMIGCAGIGVLCNYAYGVEAIPWNGDLNLQATLFAHELSHNCGGIHINDPNYVMNPYITYSTYGFSQQSIYYMNAYMNTKWCV